MSAARRWAAVLVVACLGLAGCSGIPVGTHPVAVSSVPLVEPQQPKLKPYQNEQPRNIVSDFLYLNAFDAANHHLGALQYLTPAARPRWNDATATVVDDLSVGTYSPRQPRIVVTAREVGTIDQNGTYAPTQNASGGTQRVTFVYKIAKVAGQYRISSPYPGLLLTTSQFQTAYTPRPVYFFDRDNEYLVPDARWTALTGAALQQWLLEQIASGPSASLQNAVNSDTLPSPQDNTLNIRRVNGIDKIDILGAGQLDGTSRNALAAQIGKTLGDAEHGVRLEITDSQRPVTIPEVGSSVFDAADFPDILGPTAQSPDVYYLQNGHIVDSAGQRLKGPLNSGRYGFLDSLAMTRLTPHAQFSAAAVADSKLLVGTQSQGFTPTTIKGSLSRPAWDPGRDEVWVADGSTLYQVTVSGTKPKPAKVTLQGPVGKKFAITAIRFSPEGDRLALVIRTAAGRALFEGAVVRSGGQVRLSVTPVSPNGASVTDVAWVEPMRLMAIGTLSLSHESRIFTSYVDGAQWSAVSIGTLPTPLTSLTVVPGQQAWVSASGAVWAQNASGWESPGPTGQTSGEAPIYLG